MKKYIFIFLLSFFIISGVQAQTKENSGEKEAEELFQNLFPLGISIGIEYSTWKTSGTQGDFNFKQDDLWIPEFALNYDFFQKNRFNFSIGVKTRFFQRQSFLPLNYSNYDNQADTDLISNRVNEYTLNFPLTVEYISALSEDLWLSFHAGYELQYYGNNSDKRNSQRNIQPQGVIYLSEYAFKDHTTHGLNLGGGIYKQFGSKFVKFELNYHLHFSDLITQELVANNLLKNSDVSAKNTWKGNYLAFKMTFYLFNKK